MYFNKPHIQRDPNITKMRMDVFGAIEKIAKESFAGQPDHTNHEIKFVSFEDALKELLAIKKNRFV